MLSKCARNSWLQFSKYANYDMKPRREGSWTRCGHDDRRAWGGRRWMKGYRGGCVQPAATLQKDGQATRAALSRPFLASHNDCGSDGIGNQSEGRTRSSLITALTQSAPNPNMRFLSRLANRTSLFVCTFFRANYFAITCLVKGRSHNLTKSSSLLWHH